MCFLFVEVGVCLAQLLLGGCVGVFLVELWLQHFFSSLREVEVVSFGSASTFGQDDFKLESVKCLRFLKYTNANPAPTETIMITRTAINKFEKEGELLLGVGFVVVGGVIVGVVIVGLSFTSQNF